MANKDGRVRSVRTIEALSAPARQELVDTLEALGGAASASELARQLGKPVDGLYYHLRLLVRAGLLVEQTGTSRAGRRERRYGLAGSGPRGPRLTLAYEPESPPQRRAVSKVVASMLRITERDFASALSAKSARVEGPLRELWAARSKGWVDERNLAELNRLLARVSSLLKRSRPGPSDRLMSVCFVLAPVAARPERRPARAATRTVRR